ncbi:MAG: GYD domain-containing protein [bacterium]|nr:GYD domain-containing protein [bacterium]
MGTYLMFGNYSEEALQDIGSARTAKAMKIIEDMGGSVVSMYALLGVQDLVLIVDMPSAQAAAKASVTIGRMTGIMFSTSPAIPVNDFDQMMEELGKS